jgi:hypothetical protein
VYEVINCGVSGYATREERLFYELIASRYKPDIALLLMVYNDDRSWRDDVRLGYYHSPDKAGQLLFSWQLRQSLRESGRRPKPDFTPNVGEILKLREECRQQNARLAVAFFRNENKNTADDWQKLVDTVSRGLDGKGIPMIDLGNEFRQHSFKELMVHDVYDAHPNEIAHRIAAEQLQQFLRREGFID